MPMRLFALLTALVLLCSGCVSAPSAPSVSANPSADLSAPDPSAVDVSAPDEPVPEPPAHVSTPDPAPVENSPIQDVPPPTDTPAPIPEQPPDDSIYEPDVPAVHIPEPQLPSTYNFAVPVAERPAVDADYFADAAFVGDSRTEGFWLYSGVKRGKLLSATGLTVFSVDKKTAFGTNQTVLQALTGGSFGKIYLAFGLNELGYIDTDSFVQTYCQLIDTIRGQHPNAIIYIQNLIPVNDQEARASGHKGHVNCDRIRLYNEMIAQIALEKELPLLDLYSAFAVDGQLPAEASRDGVHPLPAYYKKQLDFLMTHTVTVEDPSAEEPAAQPPVDAPAPERSPEMEVTEI